jgi:hypothetical protein
MLICPKLKKNSLLWSIEDVKHLNTMISICRKKWSIVPHLVQSDMILSQGLIGFTIED